VLSGVTERLGALGHIDTLGPNLTQGRIPELLINLSKSSMVLKQRFPCRIRVQMSEIWTTLEPKSSEYAFCSPLAAISKSLSDKVQQTSWE